VAISVNNVHREWVALYRWHDFDIELVPASLVETWTIPIGEEGGHCPLSVWSLHPGDEFTIVELLISRNRATFEVGGSNAYNGD